MTAAELLRRAHALSKELEDAEIWNEIRLFREDGITVLARVPGEYWEIDLLEETARPMWKCSEPRVKSRMNPQFNA
jgi:hypothetical protein